MTNNVDYDIILSTIYFGLQLLICCFIIDNLRTNDDLRQREERDTCECDSVRYLHTHTHTNKINTVVSDCDQQHGSTITSRLDRHQCKQELSDVNCLKTKVTLHVDYFCTVIHVSVGRTAQSGNYLETEFRAAWSVSETIQIPFWCFRQGLKANPTHLALCM